MCVLAGVHNFYTLPILFFFFLFYVHIVYIMFNTYMCFISHRTVLVALLIIIYSLHIERLPKYHVCGLIKLLFPNDRSLNTYQ